MPRVSVILTSYNHARFLRAAIDSTLAQTYRDFELIIWDDASTDESWDIIQSYADPRIRPFQNPRRERPVYGMNRAIAEVATGELIAIHHSDDVWKPDKLAAQVAFLDAHPQHGAVFTAVEIIDERGDPFTDAAHPYTHIFEQPNRSRHAWLNYFFFNGNALCHPSALIRRSFFDTYGLYGRGFSLLTDLDTWIRLCLHHEIHVLPQKLVQFRILEGNANASTTTDTPVRAEFERLQVLQNFLQVTDWEEMLAIFPQARQYEHPGYFDARFVLAMMAMQAKHSKPTLLFGLNLLFEALRDPPRAATLRDMYGFDIQRFHEMKGANSIFGNFYHAAIQRDRKSSLADQADALEEQLQVTYARLDEIENSAGWRLLQSLRALRLRMAPPNSARERLWYAVLHLFKSPR